MKAGIVAAVLIVGLVIALPSIQIYRETGGRGIGCPNCLKAISLALHSYHADHGSFPPARILDDTGRPMHSWRVAVLPYLDEQELYDAYDFSKPWNSPGNLELGRNAPSFFRCNQCQSRVAERKSSATARKNGATLGQAETTVLAITGPGTCWPNNGAVRRDQIRDSAAQTAQIISLPETNVHWLSPEDYFVGDSLPAGEHGSGHYVGFANGAVRFLRDDQPLQPLATIDGGEFIDTETFDRW